MPIAKDEKSLFWEFCCIDRVYSAINTTVHRCRLTDFQYYYIFLYVGSAVQCCHAVFSVILQNETSL